MRVSGLRVLTILPLVALVLAACGTSSTSQTRVNGGTATFAEAAAAVPNYIFPLTNGAEFTIANLTQFQFLMFRPLYWFGNNGVVKLNSSLSLANDPVYSADGKTVTMTLKGWKWADGTTITSRDVEFWMNLLKAEKGIWAGYAPGEFPDNVVGMSFPDSMTVVFTLDKAYGHTFFTYNELSQISPLPQHAWDKTSVSGTICAADTVNTCDRDPATAKLIYKFLDGQAKSLATYATNPLWQVVDGPWKLKSFTTEGNVAMVPNPGYSGPVKPTLAEFDEVPFTTDTAEFNVVHSAGVDYGYIPYQSLSEKGALSKYTFAPWTGWQITYFAENFNNPTNGAIYKQLYFRQAIQHLVDQKGWIKDILKGYGVPTYGPVPILPPTFADSVELSNPYPYDIAAAKTLLTNNGWTVNPGGVSTCSSPGSGTGQCGAGISAGQRAVFHLEYATGTVYITQEMQALKTAFSSAGMELDLSQAPFNTVLTDAYGGGSAPADMNNWGAGWIFSPDYYPTGDEIFSSTAGSNSGAYSDATNDANTVATTLTDDVSALHTYEDYLAKNLPVVWFPLADSQLSMVKKTLHGWDPQDPLLNIYPENWYFTTS